jgi:hypothetical protein
MTNLHTNLYKIVFDSDIKMLMDSINCEQTFADSNLTDDGIQTKEYLTSNHPEALVVLNSVSSIISSKYIQPEFPDKTPVVVEMRLNEGCNSGNIEYHCDKVAGDFGLYGDTEKLFQEEIDIICLYYFNTLDIGPLCLLNKITNVVEKVYPEAGKLAMINEGTPGMLHKIENYDTTNKRYTARIGISLQ